MRGRTSARAIEIAERQRQAVELRRAGATLSQIAQQLGYATPMGAWKAIVAVLKRNEAVEADALRALEGDRLDRMWAAIWPVILQRDAELRQKLPAVDRLLGITDRRRAMYGLDAPVLVDVEAVVRAEAERAGLDPDEVVREAAGYLREQRRR